MLALTVIKNTVTKRLCNGYWKLSRTKNVLKVIDRPCAIVIRRNLKKIITKDLENKDEKNEPNWLFLGLI